MNKKLIYIFIAIAIIVTVFIIKIPKKDTKITYDNNLYSNKVISNKYIEKGINLKVEIHDIINPKLLIKSSKKLKELEFNKLNDNLYDIDCTKESLLQILDIVEKCKKEFKTNAINKKACLEVMLIKILRVLKDEEIS